MPSPMFHVRNALGSFLGYAGCRLCGRTYFGVEDLNATFHLIELPSTRVEERDLSGRLVRGGQRGWYPMCAACWAARTPTQRMAAMEEVMATRHGNFSAAEIADIRTHTLGPRTGAD